jgi:hypothetical protein
MLLYIKVTRVLTVLRVHKILSEYLKGTRRKRVLVGKHEEKRPLGRTRRRWEDNIKMNLQIVGMGLWTGSSWLREGTGCGHL